MALLDDFLSSPYGGLLGSLLGRSPESIYASLQSGARKAQDAGNSRQGFDEAGFAGLPQAAQPMPQPTPQPAPQDQPTSMGSYGGVQYPIYGAPDATAALPPTATPTQFQPSAPAQAPIPGGVLTSGGGFGGAFRGLAANAQGGPIGMLLGAIAGGAGMGQGNPQAIQLAILRAKVTGLMQQPGMTIDKALAIASQEKTAENYYSHPATIEAGVARQMENGSGGLANALALKNEIDRQAAQTKALGDAQGKNEAELPKAITGAQTTIDAIDKLASNPGLKYIVGPLSLAPTIPGTSQASAKADYDMVSGKAFVTGIQSLKGNGMRITQAEALRSEQAQARLNRAQSEPDLRAALADMRNLTIEIARNNQTMAGQSPTFSAPKASSAGLPAGWTVKVH